MIIGLSGKARVGKDTLAKYASTKHGLLIDSFAAPIKEFWRKACGWSDLQLFSGQEKEQTVLSEMYDLTDLLLDLYKKYSGSVESEVYADEHHHARELLVDSFYKVFGTYIQGSHILISPRKAMQLLGTEVCRSLDKNFWVSIMENKIRQLPRSFTADTNHTGIIITDVRFDNEAEMIRKYGTVILIGTTNFPEVQTVGIENHKSEGGITLTDKDYMLFNIYNEPENMQVSFDHLLSKLPRLTLSDN